MIGSLQQFLRHLRDVVEDAPTTDGEHLEAFLRYRSEAAFAALVHRHGPMVHGVCQRITGNVHDAEDAFQATFLVLARKADSIVPRHKVSHWLYGVAYRTAMKAKAKTVRRYAREKQVPELPPAEVASRESEQDLRSLLDQELHRLPDKYRSALILCLLEGRSRKEVADELNVPEGTLSSRLAAAKQLLARRLQQRGVKIAGGTLAALLSAGSIQACPAAHLFQVTVETALAFAFGQAAGPTISAEVFHLAKGMMHSMFVNQVKRAAVLFFTILLLASSGVLALQGFAAPQASETSLPQQVGPPRAIAPQPMQPPKDWYRPAPYGSMGFPDPMRNRWEITKLALHGPAQKEIAVTRDQLSSLHRQNANLAAAERKFYADLTPQQRRARAAELHAKKAKLWDDAQKNIERVLTQKQKKRLQQLNFQRHSHAVFFYPIGKALRISAQQKERLRTALKQHQQRVAGFRQQQMANRFQKNQQSYREFWDKIYWILTPAQRRIYDALAGAPVKQ